MIDEYEQINVDSDLAKVLIEIDRAEEARTTGEISLLLERPESYVGDIVSELRERSLIAPAGQLSHAEATASTKWFGTGFGHKEVLRLERRRRSKHAVMRKVDVRVLETLEAALHVPEQLSRWDLKQRFPGSGPLVDEAIENLEAKAYIVQSTSGGVRTYLITPDGSKYVADRDNRAKVRQAIAESESMTNTTSYETREKSLSIALDHAVRLETSGKSADEIVRAARVFADYLEEE